MKQSKKPFVVLLMTLVLMVAFSSPALSLVEESPELYESIEVKLTTFIDSLSLRSDVKELLQGSITTEFVSDVENIADNENEMFIQLITYTLKLIVVDNEWIHEHINRMKNFDIGGIVKYLEENIFSKAPHPDLGLYHTHAELQMELAQLEKLFPNIMDLISIGKSWQNRDIWLVRITNESIHGEKPVVLFVGGHHANEAIGVETCLRFIKHLLENYGHDPLITDAVNNEIILIVPMLNPDGLEYINVNYYADWVRKNLRDGSPFIGGVDLNRNYSFNWGVDVDPEEDRDTSHDSRSPVYCGPYAFSEPETQAIQGLTQQYNIRYALSFHSGIEDIIYPWGYSPNPPPHLELYKAICERIKDETGYPYTQGYYFLYPTSGTFEDHMYGVNDTITLCAEIYGGWDNMWDMYNPPEGEISICTSRCLPLLEVFLLRNLPLICTLEDIGGITYYEPIVLSAPVNWENERVHTWVEYQYSLDNVTWYSIENDYFSPFSVEWYPVGLTDSSVWVRARAHDGIKSSEWSYSTSFGVDIGWPQFAGDAQNTGHAWGPGPADNSLLWSFQTGGAIRSAPAVINDVVYLGSDDGSVYALDARTGRQKWKFSTNGVVKSSPAVVDGKVYVVFSVLPSGKGRLWALDSSTGRPIWSRPGIFYTTDPTEASISPTVVDNAVYIGGAPLGTSDEYYLYKFNAHTGELIWQSSLWAAPVGAPAVADGVVAMSIWYWGVQYFNADTGEMIWYAETTEEHTSSPVVSGGKVFYEDAWSLYSVNIADGSTVWRRGGEEKWSEWEEEIPLPWDSASKIHIERWELFAADVTPAVTPSRVLAPMQEFVSHWVYVLTEEGEELIDVTYTKTWFLYSFNAADGGTRWKASVPSRIASPVVVTPERVYLGLDNYVYVLDADDGDLVWSYYTGARIQGGSAVAHGALYIGGDDGKLYCFGMSKQQQKAADQINDAENAINTLENMVGTLQNVLVMLREAKDHLTQAKEAYVDRDYGEAYGMANSAYRLAINGIRTLER